jgi:hypothetical protein
MSVENALLEAAFRNKIKSSGSEVWMRANNECSIAFDAPKEEAKKEDKVVDKSSALLPSWSLT